MPSSSRYLRRPLIALAAMAAALFATSDASACSMMKQSQGACATVLACCTGERGGAPATHIEGAISFASPHASAVSRSVPSQHCSCRAQEPAAPAPKPSQTSAENRLELNVGSAYAQRGEAFAVRAVSIPTTPSIQSPPKVPLYLRNERLLF